MTQESSGPVVVITGASSGIGAALARELAGRHASLVLIARREEMLREMAETLGTSVEVVPGDVTRRADVDVMVRDNTRSVLHGMQVVLPHFKARKKGVLVNVSSMLSRVPDFPVRAAYSAAKAAVNSLTESLRFELAKDFPGIRVVLVLPGVVATDFGNNALGGGMDSRAIPGAQTVGEVARIVCDGLLTGPLDLYTRPESFRKVLGHLQGLGRPST